MTRKKLTASILTFLLILQTIIGIFTPINISVTPPYISTQETQAAGESWYNTGGTWDYRRQITINHENVNNVADPSTTYANFPVYIYATGLSNIKADGADIRFTSSDGITELPQEIESYSSGTLDAWVKLTLTKDAGDSTDDIIYMYYGNSSATEPAASSTYGSQNVWDSSYKMVQHLQESPANDVAGHFDSTSNANNGTPKNFSGTLNGTPSSTSTTDPATDVGTWSTDKKIDGADVFDGVDDYVDVGDDASLSFNDFTLAGWFRTTFNNGYDDGLIAKSSEYQLWTYSNDIIIALPPVSYAVVWTNGMDVLDDGTWHYLVAVKNGTNAKIFFDGIEKASDTVASDITPGASNLNIGTYGGRTQSVFNGFIDEVKISNNARSADWIKTSYNNQSSPATFYTFASEEIGNTNPNIPTLVSPASSSNTSDSTPTLSANYSDTDAGDTGTTNYRISSSSLADCITSTNIVASGASAETATSSENTTWTPSSSIGSDAAYYWCAQNNDGTDTSSWTQMGSFTLDTTGPTISLSSPANDTSTSNDQPTLTWSASDATSGIAKFQLYIDSVLDTDDISNSATSVAPANELTCGSHTWYIRAYDNVDNYTDSNTFNLIIACGGGLPPSASNPPVQPEPTPENSEGGFSVTILRQAQDDNNNTIVTLKLFAGTDTKRMAISNTEDFKYASQVSYQEEIEWELSACGAGSFDSFLAQNDSVCTVYVKFYTQYGVASEVVSDNIILKTAVAETEEQTDDSNQDKPESETEDPESSKDSESDKTNPSQSTAFIFTKTLKFGLNNNQVIQLQNKLKELNFFPQEIISNGNFGPATENAVKEYQESKGIYPCGIVGPRTRKALNNEEFITNKNYQFTQDLKYNDKNEEVKQLQIRLQDQNLFPYNIQSSGWFGPITQKAVNIFQKFYNLIQSGIVDEGMREVLNG